jgi:hypothetical protein
MISASELSNLLNKNSGNLLDLINIENVKSWCRLRNQLKETEILEDEGYQERYRKFFGIGGVGMNKVFIKRYFELLEEYKNAEEFDFRRVSLELLRDQNRRKLSFSQFAGVSKMANLINQDHPIYDSYVSELFDFDKPTSTRMDNRERLNIYLAQYNQQMDIYQQVLNNGLIHDTLTVFKILLRKYHDEEFPQYRVSDMKKIDFLISVVPQTDYKLVK